MARCPECGKWLWFGGDILAQYHTEHVCPECGAVIRRKASLGGLFLGNMESASHHTSYLPKDRDGQTDWFYNEARGPREEPVEAERRLSLREIRVKWGKCSHHRTVTMSSKANFCPDCGSRLRRGSEGATPPGTEYETRQEAHVESAMEYGDKCMVCNLEVSEDLGVVWCPYCGNPAHRMHLIDWVHVKRSCPICGEHLDDRDLR
jgi:predicted RNA-binding Zn-ribbon protein involved in translation (DUF1610 family)